MGTKKLTVTGIIIAAAAITYFTFGTSEKTTDAENNAISIANVSSSAKRELEVKTASASGNEATSNEADKSDSGSSFSDSQDSAEPIDNLEDEFAQLISEHGIHQRVAQRFILSRDFGQLFDLARESERNSESYEMEATYQDIFMDSEQVKQNHVFVNDFACDNRVCLTTVEYTDRSEIDLFMNHVFFQEGRGSVGIIARAVSLDGVKQMRIIFDYKGSPLIID